MRARVPIALLLAAVACVQPEESEGRTEHVAEAPPAGLGSLHLRVELPPIDGVPTTELWLRGPGGEVAFEFLDRDGTETWEELAPGTYDLAAKIATAFDGPWIYVEDEVRVRPGERTEVRLALPAGRTAGLAIATEEDTPPLYLVLADESTAFPADMRALGERLAQRAYPDGLRFALQSDGRSHLDALPLLAPGTWTLLWVANDWQPGDPPILPRTATLELAAGRTTTLHLEGKLTRLRVE